MELLEVSSLRGIRPLRLCKYSCRRMFADWHQNQNERLIIYATNLIDRRLQMMREVEVALVLPPSDILMNHASLLVFYTRES